VTHLTLTPCNLATYNIIGFGQRGMGRSEPTFVVPECSAYLPGSAINFNSEESIRAASKVFKKVHKNCWNYPGFQLEAGNSTYHFLEHSGTRQLAEDIERFRRIFGDQKLSVYGVSYGTVVMGVYATVFPNNVNLMVLDGSVDPNSDIISRTMDDARSKQERLDYFIASCEFGNQQCGSTDVRSCINDLLNRMVDKLGDQYESWIAPFQGILEIHGIMADKATLMEMIISVVFGRYNDVESLCNYAANDDETSFTDWVIDNLFGNNALEFQMQTSFDELNITRGENQYFFEYNSESKPTSGDHPESNWPFENYGKLVDSSLCQDLITGKKVLE
jgi:pimeloyl-ACP methyl ester carboxylesterase